MAQVSTVKPLAKTSTPGKPVVSLVEVMDEELAKKLEQEERKTTSLKTPSSTSVVDDELDADLLLALKLSEMEAKGETPADIPAHDHAQDEDYLYALKLQNELQDEEYAQNLVKAEKTAQFLQQRDRVKIQPGAKVSYTYDGYNEIPEVDDDDEDDDEDDDDEDDDDAYLEDGAEEGGQKAHHQAVKTNGRVGGKEFITKHDPVISGMKNAANLERKMDAGDLSNILINTKVHNSLLVGARKVEKDKIRVRSNRTDKSTSEQVMDPKTRISLLKMLNNGILSELHGVINTGKEANVYHALSGIPIDAPQDQQTPSEYAIKIFKTSLNEFKNRAEYVEGEFRFRHRSTSNSRKLIKLWAEKEMRNLKRIQEAGIPCPTPIILRENILVMSFLGKDGFPAPLLKDAPLSQEKLTSLYNDCIQIMRKMYQRCKLVHGDLSEYNILYFKSKLWIIDVSQAVENDHPKALEFLRRDCDAVLNFFGKRIENVMTTQQLFNFITDIQIQEDHIDSYLEKVHQIAQEISERELTNEEKVLQGVFQKSFIPRTLHEVAHPAAEIFDNSTSFHKAVTGLESDVKQEEKEEK